MLRRLASCVKQQRAYECVRFLYRQVVPEPHYPPPRLAAAAWYPWSLVEKALYRRGVLSASDLCLPHFLGLGGLQCGTTWLNANLQCHPEVFVPPVKELHYFSWRFHRTVRHYARQLEPGRGRVRGEISTEYLSLPAPRIRFVRRLLPDVRLLLMVRNPIDRAWAHARQSLMFRPQRRYSEVRPEEFLRHFRSRASLAAGNYVAGIDRWLSFFPADQLLVAVYDDAVCAPQRLLREVFNHIGVTSEVDWAPFPWGDYAQKEREAAGLAGAQADGERQDLWPWCDYNPGPPPDALLAALHDLYDGQIRMLKARLGGRVAHWG
jgi:hypothetical protein